MTKQLGPGPQLPEISEDDLIRAQGAMRYQTLSRYERMYQVVDERVQADIDKIHPLDPRFLELGIRILKEQSLLYRLARPAPAVEEEEDPDIAAVNRHQVVLEQLEALEARAREQKEPDAAKEPGAGPGPGSRGEDQESASA